MREPSCPELFIAPTSGIDEVQAARLALWLDHSEIARADRLSNFTVRRDFIAAHALRRMALSRCFPGTPPSAWVVSAAEPGRRPVVTGQPHIGVSLSHAQGLAVVAVTSNGRVGIDAETVEPELATAAIAQTFCAPEEVSSLAADGRELDCEDFFTLWTLKESLLKATGSALVTPPEAIAFSLSPPELRKAPAAFGPYWSFWTFRTGAYRVSVSADVANASRIPLSQTLWDLVADRPIDAIGSWMPPAPDA